MSVALDRNCHSSTFLLTLPLSLSPRLALRYHPDKVLSSSSTSDTHPHQKFQQINFSYGVLSDEKRRKRYDDTGRTDEPMFMEDGFSWDDYFKEMWQGNVSGSKLDEFKKNYQSEFT